MISTVLELVTLWMLFHLTQLYNEYHMRGHPCERYLFRAMSSMENLVFKVEPFFVKYDACLISSKFMLFVNPILHIREKYFAQHKQA